ncbi:MAG TPA: DUF4198 domain-containing protein [Candidatus Krumholzibacteria bacterium]|nr:DUF4198 domain-containing protein [Candidatus Krumholzibacteria bacterium]
MRPERILTLAMAMLCTSSAFAHDTWLLPRVPRVPQGDRVAVDLTSGMSFPPLESGIKSDRIARGAWRIAGKKGKLDGWQEEDSSLVMRLVPTASGTATLYLSLKPKDIDLDAEEIAHYFDEIGAPESLRRDWETSPSPGGFHETYTKHAKSFMRVGDAGEDDSCTRPVGLAIEFIPQRDPTALAVGDSLVVKVVKGGDDELESFPVGIVCGATGEAIMKRTNQSGLVAFSITSAGWWLVRGTELRRKADHTFESDFSTMTFFVEE